MYVARYAGDIGGSLGTSTQSAYNSCESVAAVYNPPTPPYIFLIGKSKPYYCQRHLLSHHKINTSLIMLREWSNTASSQDALENTSPLGLEIYFGWGFFTYLPSGCKISTLWKSLWPQGMYFPIHSSSRQMSCDTCIFNGMLREKLVVRHKTCSHLNFKFISKDSKIQHVKQTPTFGQQCNSTQLAPKELYT